MKKFILTLIAVFALSTSVFASADTEATTAPNILDLSSTTVSDSGTLIDVTEIDTLAELDIIVADKVLADTAAWVVASSANVSCVTTCGIATPLVAVEATGGLFVAIDDATADSCICDGATS